MDEIIKRIKIFEGYSSKPYRCPADKWTIGYGYNFEDRGFETDILVSILNGGFSRETAEKLLAADVKACVETAESVFKFFGGLNGPRRAVVADMVYQLGLAGFQAFHMMMAALDAGDFERAAMEMKNSRWYGQSGRRSRINTEQMRTGEWQEAD